MTKIRHLGALLPNTASAGVHKVLYAYQSGQINEYYNFPPVQNTQTQLFLNQDVYYQALLPAIQKAKRFVYFINFVTETKGLLADSLLPVLQKKAQEKTQTPLGEKNIQVGLLVDDFGSEAVMPWAPANKKLQALQHAGVDVFKNRWLSQGFEHRKIMVADDGKGSVVAYLGGWCAVKESVAPKQKCIEDKKAREQGRTPPVLDEKEPAYFHDGMLEFKGDGARQILSLTLLAFMYRGLKLLPNLSSEQFKSWYYGDAWLQNKEVYAQPMEMQLGQTLPMAENKLRDYMLEILDEAIQSKTTDTVDIEVAYLVIPKVIERLCTLAKNNVKVRLLVPGDVKEGFSDSVAAYYGLRVKYPELLKAGVEVHEYQGYNHAKGISVNRGESIWWSTGNPDPISWRLSRDATVLLRNNKELGEDMHQRMFEVSFKNAKKMTLAEVQTYPEGNVNYYWGRFCSWLASWF